MAVTSVNINMKDHRRLKAAANVYGTSLLNFMGVLLNGWEKLSHDQQIAALIENQKDARRTSPIAQVAG